MAAIAGKVAITPKGVWDVATQYEKLDFVLYGDDSYVARKESVGVEPGTDEETWMLSLRGASAQQIQDIINGTTTVGNADKLDGKSAEEFLQTTGGTINGQIYIKATENKNSALALRNDAREIASILYTGDSLFALRDNTNGINIITSSADGTNTFNGTASGNLPLTGGTITGELKLKKADNGYANIFKNNSATVDYGTRIMDYSASGKKAGIAISATGQLIDLVKNDGSTSEILHTGNKPTGSYTGNGSATERTISAGAMAGWGFIIRKVGTTDFAIVTSAGYIAKQNSAVIVGADAFEKGGNIYLKTTAEILNASGYTYIYYGL